MQVSTILQERENSIEWGVPTRVTIETIDGGAGPDGWERVRLLVRGVITLDPEVAGIGRPLTPGDWVVRPRLAAFGLDLRGQLGDAMAGDAPDHEETAGLVDALPPLFRGPDRLVTLHYAPGEGMRLEVARVAGRPRGRAVYRPRPAGAISRGSKAPPRGSFDGCIADFRSRCVFGRRACITPYEPGSGCTGDPGGHEEARLGGLALPGGLGRCRLVGVSFGFRLRRRTGLGIGLGLRSGLGLGVLRGLGIGDRHRRLRTGLALRLRVRDGLFECGHEVDKVPVSSGWAISTPSTLASMTLSSASRYSSL